MEFNPCNSIINIWLQKISIHNLPLLDKERKVIKMGVWLLHTLIKNNNKDDGISRQSSFKTEEWRFSRILLQETKNGYFRIFRTKDSEMTRRNLCRLLQRRSCLDEKLCCMYGGILIELFILSFKVIIRHPI